MDIERQVEIIEKQLSAFHSLEEKLMYMVGFFVPDPKFSKEACDLVMGRLWPEGEGNETAY